MLLPRLAPPYNSCPWPESVTRSPSPSFLPSPAAVPPRLLYTLIPIPPLVHLSPWLTGNQMLRFSTTAVCVCYRYVQSSLTVENLTDAFSKFMHCLLGLYMHVRFTYRASYDPYHSCAHIAGSFAHRSTSTSCSSRERKSSDGHWSVSLFVLSHKISHVAHVVLLLCGSIQSVSSAHRNVRPT